jgi:hypothetical protein
MAQFVTLAASPRDKTGKGAERQIRFRKKVPAVIYGHGRPSQPLESTPRRWRGAHGINPPAHHRDQLEGKKRAR